MQFAHAADEDFISFLVGEHPDVETLPFPLFEDSLPDQSGEGVVHRGLADLQDFGDLPFDDLLSGGKVVVEEHVHQLPVNEIAQRILVEAFHFQAPRCAASRSRPRRM